MAPRHSASRGSALRVMLWLVGSVLVLALFALVLFNWALRSRYEPVLARFQKEVTENVDYFCEQQGVLSADPWFHEPRAEGDAGPLLNAWLPWEPKQTMPRGSPLTVPAHLPQKAGDFKDWLSSPVDVSGLDFAWMRTLQAYDRWDLLKSAPVAPGAKIDWINASLPLFIDLQLWTKFRLLHGLRTGEPLEAARDVRHLAWLAFRTDTMLGGAIANALLRLERAAYDSLPQPPPDWKPMSVEQLDRMRAITMTGFMFSNMAAPPEVAKQSRRCGEPAVSRCIALGEAVPMAKLLQPFAQSEYPEQYAALTEDLAAFSCPTSLPRTLWERGVTLEETSPTGSKLSPQVVRLGRLPRAIFGPHIAGILLSAGTPGLKRLHEFRATYPAARPTEEP